MKVLSVDIRFILPSEFSSSDLLSAIEEFLKFARDPGAGLDAPPTTTGFSTKWGALNWNSGLGLRSAVDGAVRELGEKWVRVDSGVPIRAHRDERMGNVWVK